jgi:hypothetical protein
MKKLLILLIFMAVLFCLFFLSCRKPQETDINSDTYICYSCLFTQRYYHYGVLYHTDSSSSPYCGNGTQVADYENHNTINSMLNDTTNLMQSCWCKPK